MLCVSWRDNVRSGPGLIDAPLITLSIFVHTATRRDALIFSQGASNSAPAAVAPQQPRISGCALGRQAVGNAPGETDGGPADGTSSDQYPIKTFPRPKGRPRLMRNPPGRASASSRNRCIAPWTVSRLSRRKRSSRARSINPAISASLTSINRR